MRTLDAMLADLNSSPFEMKRAILLRALEELLGGTRHSSLESVAPSLRAQRLGLDNGAMTDAASPTLVVGNAAPPHRAEHAGRSMSLREIIDIVEWHE